MGNVALQWGPTAALLAASGYFLLLVLVVRRRGLSGATERWFAAYLVLSVVWTVAWALSTQWGWIKPGVADLAYSLSVYTAAYLSPMLAVLTLSLAGYAYAQGQPPPPGEYPYGPDMMNGYGGYDY